MKHVFILNPKAGSGAHLDEARAAIRSLGGDVTLYETKAPKDATRYIRKWCESHTEDVRFYACGGDGTIKEVAARQETLEQHLGQSDESGVQITFEDGEELGG